MRLLTELHKQFVQNGINLPEEVQAEIREINGELSELQARYGENLLAETNGFELQSRYVSAGLCTNTL